jgi:hypothetical protein
MGIGSAPDGTSSADPVSRTPLSPDGGVSVAEGRRGRPWAPHPAAPVSRRSPSLYRHSARES